MKRSSVTVKRWQRLEEGLVELNMRQRTFMETAVAWRGCESLISKAEGCVHRRFPNSSTSRLAFGGGSTIYYWVIRRKVLFSITQIKLFNTIQNILLHTFKIC
jgi:hypothetical protein